MDGKSTLESTSNRVLSLLGPDIVRHDTPRWLAIGHRSRPRPRPRGLDHRSDISALGRDLNHSLTRSLDSTALGVI